MALKAYGPLHTEEGPVVNGTVETDILIVGSGLAGLWAAHKALVSGAKTVAVVDKGSIGESSQSRMSAGATLYMTNPDDLDSWKQEFADQQKGLSRGDLVERMLKDSSSLLKQEQELGLRYEKMPWGSPELPVGGTTGLKMHVLPRYRDMGGGAALLNVIKDRAIEDGVRIYSKTMITELIKRDGRVTGASGLNRLTGQKIRFSCKALVLAAGDCSFGNSGCIGQATGDSYALAFQAGAKLANMEFWGSNTGSPQYAFESISDTAADFNCHFSSPRGERFMQKYSRRSERAEPYVAARAIAEEAEICGGDNGDPFHFHMNNGLWKLGYRLVLNRKMNGFVTEMFHVLADMGINAFGKPMTWCPVLRTLRGGVVTDSRGASDIPGLFAAGTAQSMDPIGLNGISTLRAIWSGYRAGEGAAHYISELEGMKKAHSPDAAPEEESQTMIPPSPTTRRITVQQAVKKLQDIMFPWSVSLRKDGRALQSALGEIEELRAVVAGIKAVDLHGEILAMELKNMILCARLYLTASLERRESRGEHFRTDFPDTDNLNWCKWITLSKRGEGIAVNSERLEEYFK